MRDLIIYSVRSLETTGDLTSSGATYRTPTYTTFVSLTFSFEHADVRCSQDKDEFVGSIGVKTAAPFSALDAADDRVVAPTAVRNCDVSSP